MKHRLLKTLLICNTLCVSSTFAANGAFDFGFSEITRGMAGAGSALPQDAVIAAINPAGMVEVGKRLDLGAEFYFPNMHYTATSVTGLSPANIAVAPGTVRSSETLFFLPDFGMNFPINHKSSFGVSVYSLAGFGAKWRTKNNATVGGGPKQGALGDGTLLSDLKQSLIALTYSRRFLSRSSWGISLLTGFQMFRNAGAANLGALSAHPNNVSGKGTDYSVGLGTRLGFLFGVLPKLDLSISYQPRVYMTKFHRYAGLFPNSGEFDYPPFGNIGLAWHVVKSFVIAADIEKIWNKDISNYGASHDALVNGTCSTDQSTCMGGSNGAGFGWSNAIIYKLGAQWKATNKTTLRAGYNHGSKVLSSTYATENMITPGALIRDLFTVGITQKIAKKDFINGVITFIPKQSINSLNEFSGAAKQTVNLDASGLGFGISWSRVFA